ncbi:MAG TPA: SelB C-terminal domain-containing protein, partial [Anaerolineales bacterium]|nr:SelB C-terminal domain-containing protein [Anaerolineales bacterium]
VDDPDWLSLVEGDIRQALAGTVLGKAPIVPVSARKRVGLELLLSELSAVLAERPARIDLGRPRLPVDRVFTIAGFGTVVTGTLSDGSLRLGDEVEILPDGLKGRVRGLQTHKKKEDMALPGTRTAVNISGVTVDQIRRGNVVAHPREYHPTTRLDARFRLLPEASQPVKHNSQVKLFIGSDELVARLRLLGTEELRPGEEGWIQLELAKPVVTVRGDRYILRRPSPGETLGGGMVVDPHPKGRHRRFAADTLARLEALSQGTPADILLQALIQAGVGLLKDVIPRTNLDATQAESALGELRTSGQIKFLESGTDPGMQARDSLVTTRGYWDQLSAKAVQEVDRYHRANPLRRGMPREELKSRIKLSPRLFATLIPHWVAEGQLIENGPLVYRPGHEIQFSPDQELAVGRLMARFASTGFAPPSVKESQADVGEDVYTALVDLGRLVQLSPDVVFSKDVYERMVREILRLMDTHGNLTAGQVRDHFNTSRRYVLALLEHMDSIGLTVREGDIRHRKN